MSRHHFTARHDAAAHPDELLGSVSLTDDTAAHAFDTSYVRSLKWDTPTRHEGWTLQIAQGDRLVATIPFSKLDHRRLEAIPVAPSNPKPHRKTLAEGIIVCGRWSRQFDVPRRLEDATLCVAPINDYVHEFGTLGSPDGFSLTGRPQLHGVRSWPLDRCPVMNSREPARGNPFPRRPVVGAAQVKHLRLLDSTLQYCLMRPLLRVIYAPQGLRENPSRASGSHYLKQPW